MRSQLAKQENSWPLGSSPWLDEKIGYLWYLSQLAADLGVIARGEPQKLAERYEVGPAETGPELSNLV